MTMKKIFTSYKLTNKKKQHGTAQNKVKINGLYNTQICVIELSEDLCL